MLLEVAEIMPRRKKLLDFVLKIGFGEEKKF
jgi:hypothetical protein